MSHALPILPPEESMPLRILVVDDHPSFRRALTSALRLVREVEIVGEVDGGLAAVERAQRSSADMVLMDLSMPDIDGIEAMRRIRATRPDLPVVILTAHADPGIEREAFAAGASGFLAKGVSLEELVGVLRQAAAARV
jgi:DNA-binding NarL/FixJ family response regulator